MRLGTGLIFSRDTRDDNYRYALSGEDWKFKSRFHHIPELSFQGSESSCVGHSTHLATRMPPKPVPYKKLPSQSKIYDEAREIEGMPNYQEGTSLRSGLQYLKQEGFIKEYRWLKTIVEIEDAIRIHGPVVCGTIWPDGMANANGSGYVSPSGRDSGMGHAYVFCGVDAERGFLIGNSHGYQYGINGLAWVKHRGVQILLDKDGQFALPIK